MAAGTAPDPAVPSGLAKDLLAVLDAQATVYGHLLLIAHERHATLVAADVDRLSGLSEREQPLLSRVRRLESARLQVVAPWAGTMRVTPEQVTVTDLVDLLDPPTGSQLAAARDRLLEVVEAVNRANERNARLPEACLGSVNESVQHLLQAVQLDPRYARSGGRASQEASPRITDYRA